MNPPFRLLWLFCVAARLSGSPVRPGDAFLEKHCYDCHDEETKKGGLDLTALPFYLDDPKTFATWVKVHDRTRDGKMPPKEKAAGRGKRRGSGLAAWIAGTRNQLAATRKTRAANGVRRKWGKSWGKFNLAVVMQPCQFGLVSPAA